MIKYERMTPEKSSNYMLRKIDFLTFGCSMVVLLIANPSALCQEARDPVTALKDSEPVEITIEESSITADDLSPTELEAFEAEALKRTAELGNYIKVIGDKSKAEDVKIKSIDLAVKLFVDEDQTVQVSSRNNTDINAYRIRRYLNNLRVLDYRRVEIEWYDVLYIRDFKKGMNGKYYATITVFQKFKGYDAEGFLVYEDITQKDVEVIIDSVVMRIGEKEIEEWDVKLRNIQVVETS